MRLRLSHVVQMVTLTGVLAVIAWACGSSTGTRDKNYGTDLGAGYTGPEGGPLDAAGADAADDAAADGALDGGVDASPDTAGQ